jgi:hypothetical protein
VLNESLDFWYILFSKKTISNYLWSKQLLFLEAWTMDRGFDDGNGYRYKDKTKEVLAIIDDTNEDGETDVDNNNKQRQEGKTKTMNNLLSYSVLRRDER